MKLVFYSVVLNHHQAPVADEIYKIIGADFVFVETIHSKDCKGVAEDYSSRPYLLKAWDGYEKFNKAMQLAITADVAVFGGYEGLVFEKARMKRNLLTFDVSERWLKRGWLNVFSPKVFLMFITYHLEGWKHKPIYKLCQSSFAASDQYKLGTFKNKCYKWGYFVEVEQFNNEAFPGFLTTNTTSLMWCARYLKLKHPELPIMLAERLKQKGYKFHLDMYGDGEYRKITEEKVENLGLTDVVTIHGHVTNAHVREAMKKSDIFLFTSDRNEGWGAVANESLSNGCALVASDAIGSSAYLINGGVNGYMFQSAHTAASFNNPDKKALNDLTNKVIYLLDNKDKLYEMKRNAVKKMQALWSPKHATESFLQLIDDLKDGGDTSIKEGPCSKA